MNDGYVYTTREQFAKDKEFTRASMQRARAEIAMKLFGTANVATPTKTLERFWAKTGVAKTKTLNEIIAIILNTPGIEWAREYNLWTTLKEGSQLWATQAKILMDMAIKVFQPSKTKAEQKPAKKSNQKPPPPQKKPTPEEREKEAKEAAVVAAIMKKGGEHGLNFASLKRPNQPPGSQAPPAVPSAAVTKAAMEAAIAAANSAPPASATKPNGNESTKNKRFDKLTRQTNGDANSAANGQPQPGTSASANDGGADQGLKSVLKPPSGLQKKPGRKQIVFDIDKTTTPPEAATAPANPPPSNKKKPAATATFEEVAAATQDKVDKMRQRTSTNANVESGVRGRLGKKEDGAKIDFTLIDLLHSQQTLHKAKPPPEPLPSTPEQPQSDSGVHDTAEGGDEGLDGDDDILQVSVNKNDMMFSPERTKVPPEFDPTKPPPRIPQAVTSTTSSGEVRKRVIVEDLSAATLSAENLGLFRGRLEVHVFEYNKKIPKNLPAARIMKPWLERGKIIVMPADFNTGQFVVDLVNNKEIQIPGLKLRAGWNLDLPEVALVSVYYELMTPQNPHDIIEDERTGIARQNGWDVAPTEISLFNTNPHNTKKHSTYARVVVSKRVVDLIKDQSGQIWISGGTATVQWNGKSLDHANEVQFNFQ